MCIYFAILLCTIYVILDKDYLFIYFIQYSNLYILNIYHTGSKLGSHFALA